MIEKLQKGLQFLPECTMIEKAKCNFLHAKFIQEDFYMKYTAAELKEKITAALSHNLGVG